MGLPKVSGAGVAGKEIVVKITTPDGYTIELTPQEAAILFPDLIRGARRQLEGLGSAPSEPVSEEQLIRRVIRRHRVPPGQRALYTTLLEAGEEGLDFATLAARMGRSTEELSGVLGALGRRINATPGIESLPEPPGVALLFNYKESAPPKGEWGWAMKPVLREVLERGDFRWLDASASTQ